jgi:hypothetical protein
LRDEIVAYRKTDRASPHGCGSNHRRGATAGVSTPLHYTPVLGYGFLPGTAQHRPALNIDAAAGMEGIRAARASVIPRHLSFTGR